MQTNTCCVSSPTIHVHMHISMYTYRYTILLYLYSNVLHIVSGLTLGSFADDFLLFSCVFCVFILMLFFVLHFLLLAFSFHVDTTWEWAFAVYCVDRLPLTVRSRSFINKTRQGNTWKRLLSKLLEQHNNKKTTTEKQKCLKKYSQMRMGTLYTLKKCVLNLTPG